MILADALACSPINATVSSAAEPRVSLSVHTGAGSLPDEGDVADPLASPGRTTAAQ